MPITEKEYFLFERETYPVVTIYDEEDAEEAVRVLQETEKMAISLESLSLLSEFPHLKRWKAKDSRTITEKAVHLLSQCENVTVVSVNAEGYPRPVQMSKIRAESFNEVWMATSAASEKVADFRDNSKAGLCYDHYGDGVTLRGNVEIITDDSVRKEMWQDWFIHHFPGGPSDPDYVLLHFTGTEATFWIGGEFSRWQ